MVLPNVAPHWDVVASAKHRVTLTVELQEDVQYPSIQYVMVDPHEAANSEHVHTPVPEVDRHRIHVGEGEPIMTLVNALPEEQVPFYAKHVEGQGLVASAQQLFVYE